MPKIDLYHHPLSQPSRALHALLVAGDVPFESHLLNVLKGEHKAPDILKINPAGTIPFILVDGEPLYESAAILRYIAVKFPSCAAYYPEGPEKRAMIDAALDFNGTSVRPASMGAFTQVMFPRMGKKEPSAEVHATSAASYVKFMGLMAMMNGAMEQRGHLYTGGDTITIADFQLFATICDIFYQGKTAEEEFKDLPKVLDWFNRCAAAKGGSCRLKRQYPGLLPHKGLMGN